MASRLNFFQLPDLEGSIAANGRPRVFLDGGPTYDEIVVETDLTASEIQALVLEVNGEERVRISGQQMLDREAYDGRSATSGQFVLSLADAMARTSLGDGYTGLVTQPTDRVLLTLELSSGVAGTETVTLHGLTSPNRREEFKLFILPEAVPISKTGDNDFIGFRRGRSPWTGPLSNTPSPGALAIRRFFAYGAVSHLRIEQDDRYPFGKNKSSKTVIDALLKRNGKTVPTSSTCVVYDPIHRGNGALDVFDTFSMKSLRATFTTTDSNDITALTEYVEDVRRVA